MADGQGNNFDPFHEKLPENYEYESIEYSDTGPAFRTGDYRGKVSIFMTIIGSGPQAKSIDYDIKTLKWINRFGEKNNMVFLKYETTKKNGTRFQSVYRCGEGESWKRSDKYCRATIKILASKASSGEPDAFNVSISMEIIHRNHRRILSEAVEEFDQNCAVEFCHRMGQCITEKMNSIVGVESQNSNSSIGSRKRNKSQIAANKRKRLFNLESDKSKATNLSESIGLESTNNRDSSVKSVIARNSGKEADRDDLRAAPEVSEVVVSSLETFSPSVSSCLEDRDWSAVGNEISQTVLQKWSGLVDENRGLREENKRLTEQNRVLINQLHQRDSACVERDEAKMQIQEMRNRFEVEVKQMRQEHERQIQALSNQLTNRGNHLERINDYIQGWEKEQEVASVNVESVPLKIKEFQQKMTDRSEELRLVLEVARKNRNLETIIDPEGHIDDVIVNKRLEMIERRYAKSEGARRVLTIESSFYSFASKSKIDHPNWIHGDGNILDQYDMILLPVVYKVPVSSSRRKGKKAKKASHWILIAVDLSEKFIKMYDSLALYYEKEKIGRIVKDVLKTKIDEAVVDEWPIVEAEKEPRQDNSHDCGLYVMLFAEYLTRRVDFDFYDVDMVEMRKILCYEHMNEEIL